MTYLVSGDTMTGTRQIIAKTEAEAMQVAALRPGIWRIVGTVEPESPVTYAPAFSSERERLAFERGQERRMDGE